MNAVLGNLDILIKPRYYSTTLSSEIKRVKQIAETVDRNLAITFVWQFDSVLLKYLWRASNCSSALIPRLPCGCPEQRHVCSKLWWPDLCSCWKASKSGLLSEGFPFGKGTDTIPILTLEEEGKM